MEVDGVYVIKGGAKASGRALLQGVVVEFVSVLAVWRGYRTACMNMACEAEWTLVRCNNVRPIFFIRRSDEARDATDNPYPDAHAMAARTTATT